MAKKRKKSKRSTARRVGRAKLNANSTIVKLGSVAAGFLLADKLNPLLDKVTGDKIDSKIVAGAQVGLGGLYLMKKGAKSLPLTVVSGVLAGAGIKRAMSSFGIGVAINGYQNVPAVAGYQQIRKVAGGNAGKLLAAGGNSMGSYERHTRRADTAIAGVGSGLTNN